MTKKQYNWIWILLAILPIIIIITSINVNSNRGNINSVQLLQSFGFSVNNNTEYYDGPNGKTEGSKTDIYFIEPAQETLDHILYDLFEKLMPNLSNNIIPQYIAYLIRLEIIKIALNVFLMLPRICNGFIDKIIGGTKIE